jgi:purine-binding chemotaxis protein CheW
MSGETQQLCSFLLDGALFGIEVERVQEIIRAEDVTPVPLAPAEVAGLVNLRGQIVPMVHLRRCLDMAERPPGEQGMNVVIRTEDGPVSLLVDAIGEVLLVSETSYEPPPDNLRGSTRSLVRGVYKLDGRLLLLLSVESALTRSTALLIDKRSSSEPLSEKER